MKRLNDDDQQQQQYQNDNKIATETTMIDIGTNNTSWNENENNDENEVENKNMGIGLSNSQLLVLAFISFFTFTIIQLIFSFVANSHAMLGDSFAMLIDSITYLMNYGAEYYKTKIYNEDSNNSIDNDNNIDHDDNDSVDNDEIEAESIKKQRQRQQRKRILQLEIIPPFISVIALLIITILTTQQSSVTLVTEINNDNDPLDNTQPNVVIMFGFSFTNLLIDFINVSCFARSKHLMKIKPVIIVVDDNVDDVHDNDHDHDNAKHKLKNQYNLNMCSAYTHISADTLRSITVVITSLVAILDNNVNKSIADAIAAIVVSSIILFALMPLLRGLVYSVIELRSIYIDDNKDNIIDNKEKIVKEETQTLQETNTGK